MEHDKFLHLVGSFLIAVAIYIFTGRLYMGLFLAMIIGVLKELVWDGLFRDGQDDLQDMYYNFYGVSLAWLVIFITKSIQ